MEKNNVNSINVSFNQLSAVKFPKSGCFDLVVVYHNINYKFTLDLIENSDKLIAMNSELRDINSKKCVSPIEVNQNSFNLDDSTIYYEDPTGYNDVMLCNNYYIGTKKVWYLKDISLIIQMISNNLDIDNKNVLFYGKNDGGFVSLLLSTLIRDSVSIVNVPQFDIVNYDFIEWKGILEHNFNCQDGEAIVSMFKHRFKVIELIKKENYVPNSFVILDANDNFESKSISFFLELSKLKWGSYLNCMRCYIYDKNEDDFNLEDNNIISFIINNYKFIMDIVFSSLNIDNMLDNFNHNPNLKLKNFSSSLSIREKDIDTLKNQIKQLNNELDITNIKFGEIEFDLTNQINALSKEIIKNDKLFSDKELEFNNQMSFANKKINLLQNSIDEKNNILKSKELEFNNRISVVNNTIGLLRDNLSEKEKSYLKMKNYLNQKIDEGNKDIQEKDNHIKIKQQQLLKKEKELISLKYEYMHQFNKIETKEYCISCFKEEISNNKLEIDYLKNNNLIKKILIPFSYIYLIFKSKPHEIFLNFSLYKVLKNSQCFDIGFYLNNNSDLLKSKWCNYLSLELHYVCNGFDEGRKFNKKYFNRNSKIELLEYLRFCENIK